MVEYSTYLYRERSSRPKCKEFSYIVNLEGLLTGYPTGIHL